MLPPGQRIDDLISPEPMSGCWLWLGLVNDSGYALIGEPKKRAHRIMWEREHGPIPNGLFACHKCDVPCCVNPSHLFLGTQRDNIHDMIQKGRAPKQVNHYAKRTHCPAGHPYDDINTWKRSDGGRRCKICHRDHVREWYRQKQKII